MKCSVNMKKTSTFMNRYDNPSIYRFYGRSFSGQNEGGSV